MVLRAPNSVFKRLLAGELKLGPQHLEPRKRSWGVLPPLFAENRLTKLRKKLQLAGVDPEKVGIPPAPVPNFIIPAPPSITYTDAYKEIRYTEIIFIRSYLYFKSLMDRYDFVKRQVEQMPKMVDDWRMVIMIYVCDDINEELFRLKKKSVKLFAKKSCHSNKALLFDVF